MIAPSTHLPEITFKSVILGIILTVILAAANAYLGLKVGTTVSASIPAAVISLGILRLFRQSNILENTMVQTMASVGETLTSGIAYILPALLILNVWTRFNYWETVAISLTGGCLGVLFTIPLRRALIQDKTLRYPEATAIAQVLESGSSGKATDLSLLIKGGFVSAFIVFCQSGLQILSDTFQIWWQAGKFMVGFGLGYSPALIGAGYIIGINLAISFGVGITLGWLLGMPVLSFIYGIPAGDMNTIAHSIWSDHIRYIGVGTMLLGGLWTLSSLIKPIGKSLRLSLSTLHHLQDVSQTKPLRTEHDMPIKYVLIATIATLIMIFILIKTIMIPESIQAPMAFLLSGFSTAYILLAGFAFCAIMAYFAGLVGSSTSPLSGLLVSALLIYSLILVLIFHIPEVVGIVIAISCLVVMSAGLSIANDTMQDLKVGQLVGVTPWKQQLILFVGVGVSAFIIPLILQLLYQAYGIGGVFPHPGMDPQQMLSAPQAGLMAAIAKATFNHQVPWPMIITGAVIAILCISVDEYLKRVHQQRLPVLAVGLAIYLPLDSSVPAIIGGLLSYFVNKRIHADQEKQQRGLLLSCGMVSGASLMGVLLAIPFAIAKNTDILRILPTNLEPLAHFGSFIILIILCSWFYKKVTR